MPAVTTIILPDTPTAGVTSEYAPSRQIEDGFVYTLPGVTREGDETLVLTARDGPNVRRVKCNLAVPILEGNGVDIAYTEAHTIRFNGEIIVPNDAVSSDVLNVMRKYLGVIHESTQTTNGGSSPVHDMAANGVSLF
mgnify:CR=1 FL=1